MLEGYEVPPDLIGTINSRGETISTSLYPVFRDEEELPADADLTRNIREALENSALLVVLCSPRAVASRFVAEEIRYFKELGKSDRILALMIDGEPNASDDPGKQSRGLTADLECLPEPLRFGVARENGNIDWNARTEPIAADVRPGGNPRQGWTTGAAYREELEREGKLNADELQREVTEYERRLDLARLKVVAGALAVPLGTLTQRDKAMQLAKVRQRARVLRRWLVVVGLLGLVALVAGLLAFRNQKEAERQTVLALRNQKEAEKQTLIAKEQRDRALKQVYLNTVRSAAEKVEAGEYNRAQQLLLSCPTELRGWEWWYLTSRCGPGPVRLGTIASLGEPTLAKRASELRAQLDQLAGSASGNEYDLRRLVASEPGNTRNNQLQLTYHVSQAKHGTNWYAWRGDDRSAGVLLNSFYTGFGGLTIPAICFARENAVCWRAEVSQDRSPARMAGGYPILQSGDYIAFLRERYVVGEAEYLRRIQPLRWIAPRKSKPHGPTAGRPQTRSH